MVQTKKSFILKILAFPIILFSIISCKQFEPLPNLDFLEAPNNKIGFLYSGKRYRGKISNGRYNPHKKSYNKLKINSPSKSVFHADAFFEIEGSCTDASVYNYTFLKVSKGSQSTKYFLRNNFKKKIWLRFGPGVYTIEVFKINEIESALAGEGDIKKIVYITKPIYYFKVNNVRNEDGVFLYPSDQIQSDSPKIHELANRLTKNKTTDKEKIKAIHDYVVEYLNYDFSITEDSKRKKQDALSVLKNKIGVCEGYTSLTTALLRSIGYRTKAVGGTIKISEDESGKHAWVEVFADGGWKFIDPTFDDDMQADPPYNISHSLFYLDYTPSKYIKETERPERSIDVSEAEKARRNFFI